MNYTLVKSTEKDIKEIIKYEKNTIMEYANNLTDVEINEIEEYVNNSVYSSLNDYYSIKINNKIIGCLLFTDYKDGKELKEIYLEEKYRNKGIGTNIIKDIIKKNNVVYLWVYKLNKKAISLYKRMKFNIIDETKTRYFMKYNKGE